MQYRETIVLKDGRTCVLRNAEEADGRAVLEMFINVHGQTDYLLTYPDETGLTVQQEARFLQGKAESTDEIELLAEVDGVIAGCAGISCVGRKDKVKHRAEFGISVDRAFWGLGIGRAMTRICIMLAEHAGYAQIELEAVADNGKALALYESEGFTEYGRNPRGFRSRYTGWQTVVYMRRELDGEA